MSEIQILNESGEIILKNAVNIGVSVSPSKTFAKHTLENKTVIVDDQFDNPTTLTLKVILKADDYINTYKDIKQRYSNVELFIIQTKVDTYKNMYLESIPHEENPQMFNTIAMNLAFTEQLIKGADVTKITQASSQSDVSTVKAGTKSKTDDDGTFLQRLSNKVSNFLGG